MATKREEKIFAKEMKAAKKAKRKEMKRLGIKPNLTPEQIRYNRNKAIVSKVWPIFRFFILFGLCFIILYPLIFMISTAFRPSDQMNDPSIIWIPKSLTFDNLTQTWTTMKYPTAVLNTLKFNIVSSVIQVGTCALTGYGFARFKFKGKGALFMIVVFMIIVPPQIISIDLYCMYADFNPLGIIGLFNGGKGISLVDTGWTLYLPALFANGLKAGLFIFLFRQFFKGLPKELEDAAYLDGCGPLKTFIVVMVPNAASSFLTVFLFSVVWYWNDYYVTTMFFQNVDTVGIALKNLSNTLAADLFNNQTVGPRQLIVWLESGCILAITPILVMYVFLQKYFTEGIERSGLVG